jgi:hypothetical protein
MSTSPSLELKKMKTPFIAVAALSLTLSCATASRAAQHSIQTPLGEKIVHTRLVPVLMHKAVPPFAGKHVYQGRMR